MLKSLISAMNAFYGCFKEWHRFLLKKSLSAIEDYFLNSITSQNKKLSHFHMHFENIYKRYIPENSFLLLFI